MRQDRGVADASVRPAVVNDAPAVGIVQSASWRSAYADILAPEVLAQLEPLAFSRAWRASLSAPPSRDHRLLVACAGPQVVGFLALGPSPDPDAEPHWREVLAGGVHPDARGAGHGSRLLQAAADTARERGGTALTTWVPDPDEATAAFLVAAGFAPDGAHRERVTSPDGGTTPERRFVTTIIEPVAEGA